MRGMAIVLQGKQELLV